ncbi:MULTISPECIES: PLP-dependent aminotransferase family protein [unclassified Modicisalibacter]|uniref:aminotransferase-like domain-containing protein n=1 Tax=unclassified Modicisalibacter TaxID=2679913 RepID=UPI001CCEC175|nr:MULTISPECIES: PLP-dependent aminotransferase family protein [unclassified Modicisalibacter]MBZ9559922.1 PLP-dependent aminotransferase family protein [Modicisalibacter sp. R2A 31.J]MBZ9575830.1 PLP-dependent aminotransferase family protein [Modicisalibacter sp. MOD 31.J]
MAKASDEALLAPLLASYRQQPESLGKQVRLEQALRGVIGQGWASGGKVPSQRRLCEHLGVARDTLARAVKTLIDEGWLVTGHGQGTWAQRPSSSVEAPGDAPALSRRASAVLEKAGAGQVQSGAFVPGIPDIAHFPLRKWRSLYDSVTVPHNTLLLSYSTGGYGPLKRAIRDFLQRWRGIRCDTDQIVVTEGAHQAIELCALGLADGGDRVLLDSPCYWGARNVFTACGLDIDQIPWHPASGYADAVPAGDVRLAYFTGAHQYPLSAPTRLADKQRLCARARPDYVIEDDYEYGSDDHDNLIFDPRRADRLLVGSFSKLMFPGLRLGYLVASKSLAAALGRLRSEVAREGRMLDQAVLAQFIADGDLDAWYRRIRREYLARQQVLHDRLCDLPGVVGVSPPSSAISLCLELAPDIDDVALARRLLDEQLVVRPLSPACGPGDPRRGLVMGIGMVSGQTLSREAERLRVALKRLLRGTSRAGRGELAGPGC